MKKKEHEERESQNLVIENAYAELARWRQREGG